MDANPRPRGAGTPVEQAFDIVREQVPDVLIECQGDRGGQNLGITYLVRIAGSLEAVEVESQPGDQPPYTVSDEYSSILAVDAPSVAAAILELLTA